ncbi:MAG TPA: protein-glutamate O-methyltransferase CheR [Kineosporiaceae bacterium]|nr:protein-glutamate O-methyltransferase CheR [Kineosporiaceae bacterium]
MNTGLGVDQDRMITPDEFAWVRSFLFERTGIELKSGKESMVMGRLDRRLRHYGIDSYTEYFARIGDRDPLETQLAIDLLTTNETYFFREPSHFDFLARVMGTLPVRPAPVRIWSAACSSGQEAYTIAMVLAEHLPPEQDWQVLGTDISSRMVETARRGMYPIEAAQHIPKRMLHNYCLRGRQEYEGFLAIDRQLAEHVAFREANLIDLPGNLGSFDIIFLRNVMIYFGLETKRALVARMIEALHPGGYLILSHSETLNGISTNLQTIQPSIYRAGEPG